MAPDPSIGARATAALAEEEEEEEQEDSVDREEEYEGEEEEAPSHLPLAPSSAEPCDTATTIDPSYIISSIRQLLPRDLEKQDTKEDCNKKSLALNGENGTSQEFGREERTGVADDGQNEHSDAKDPWEDSGCILWDLSASKTHAEFMVDNLLLEVLLANLHASQSIRVSEICLGIIGNLACHDDLSSSIVSKNGLIETVVQQLFLDDSTCLSEMFRLLAAGLQSNRFDSWAKALLPDHVLLRILWIIGNTLNSVLLEKCIDFLLIIANNQEVSNMLLQPLIRLEFLDLVANLLSGELSKLGDDNNPGRSSFLDPVLGLIEALSSTDNYSHEIISNGELLRLVCGVIKLPDKIEVADSCVSAIVIIANLLADEPTLELLQDFSFLRGLLDILPFVTDDPSARTAFWYILARILGQVRENDIGISTLQQFASLFADKSHLIEDDIKTCTIEDWGESPIIPDDPKSNAVTISLRRIACILEKWILAKPNISDEIAAECNDNDDGRIHRLLQYCNKHKLSYWWIHVDVGKKNEEKGIST